MIQSYQYQGLTPGGSYTQRFDIDKRNYLLILSACVPIKWEIKSLDVTSLFDNVPKTISVLFSVATLPTIQLPLHSPGHYSVTATNMDNYDTTNIYISVC